MNKKLLILLVLAIVGLFAFDTFAAAPETAKTAAVAVDEVVAADSTATANTHQVIKEKFIEGNPWFMLMVALSLVLGLAFCIERIVYLGLARINTRSFMLHVEKLIAVGDLEKAKEFCRDTRGPVASICYQGLLRANDSIDSIEHSIENYANLQLANLEKGFPWIKLFIAIAPSLGFLGTVVGMVVSFDNIQIQSDISPAIVAGGMKIALLTTIFGIVAAVVLQIFYNYIVTRVEKLTSDMEEAGIILLDALSKYKSL